MLEKFLNKYRIPSVRWQDWNYDSPAAYFVTICTQNREHYFGEIEGEEMHLSAIGKIVETQWLRTPEVRPDMNLTLDEFVVMPNHFHGILIIGDNEFNKMTKDGPSGNKIGPGGANLGDAMDGVSTNKPIPIAKNKFGPQSKNLGSVIRGFKSSVTTEIKKMFGAVIIIFVQSPDPHR
jgi:putative transposase